MKKYFITEEQIKGMANYLAELPAKFANPLLNDLGAIQQLQEISEDSKDEEKQDKKNKKLKSI